MKKTVGNIRKFGALWVSSSHHLLSLFQAFSPSTLATSYPVSHLGISLFKFFCSPSCWLLVPISMFCSYSETFCCFLICRMTFLISCLDIMHLIISLQHFFPDYLLLRRQFYLLSKEQEGPFVLHLRFMSLNSHSMLKLEGTGEEIWVDFLKSPRRENSGQSPDHSKLK